MYDSDSSYHTALESLPIDNDLQEEIAYLKEEEKNSQQIRQNCKLEIEYRQRKEIKIHERLAYLQNEGSAKVTKKQIKPIPQRLMNTIISAKEVDAILITVTSTSSSNNNQRENILSSGPVTEAAKPSTHAPINQHHTNLEPSILSFRPYAQPDKTSVLSNQKSGSSRSARRRRTRKRPRQVQQLHAKRQDFKSQRRDLYYSEVQTRPNQRPN